MRVKKRWTGILLFVFFVSDLIFIGLSSGLFFTDMPSRSEVFDCDDGVKFVYDKLERWGVGSVIVLGDLRKTGESYREGDHVWLLVRVGWFNLPIDWGKLRFSRQYLEGYSISYEQLVEFVKQDNRENGDRIIAAPG